MASSWASKQLGDLAELHKEQLDPRDSPDKLFQHFSIPAFDSSHAPAVEFGRSIQSQKFIVPENAILFSKLNPRIPRVWEPTVSTELPAIASTEFLVLVPRNGVDRRYLKYACLAPSVLSNMKERVGGTSASHQRVRPQDVLSIQVDVPGTLAEQKAIGHILGTLDDKIELNHRMNETLESMARTLFQSWFVDFDPVHAKAEGSSSGLPAAIDALFPSSFQESESGQIPDGWSSATLAELILLNPETWSRTTYPEVVNYVDLSNAKWGHVESTVRYDQSDAPSRAQRVLRRGDSIVGMVRPGNGSYALVADDGLTGSTGFAVLRPRKKTHRDFVYLAATNPENIDRLAHLADGGAYPAVLPNTVIATRVVCPSDTVMSSFSRLVAPMLDRVAACDRESHTLASLRDTLLPRLLSGELRVKDAKRFVQERGL
ncbi:MAG: restriction endonuclease subunit S [Candidatus Cryosericum sp.]